jgi:hypothetical protein
MGRLAQALVRSTIALLVAASTGWLTPHTAAAEAHSYALVIGANRGGSGQAPLQYAQRDAQHFASLLVELGRTPSEHVTLLLDPAPAQIAGALQQLRTRLSVHAQAGEHAKLLFFYSGHARARSLSLAAGELPLDALREALLALPSTLTVAILDACQSGAISNIKGAVPTADFSASTISDLNNAGVAVMASSTALELSQESPELGASYFTHHLVTGLRGAADRDHDASVSLDEVYAYAYHHTLSDTARTRVGSQHATLEMELKGHGSVPLTYTRDADAQLRLSEELDGRIVVQQRGRGAVLAELSKAYGNVLTLAFPHGDYEVLVRRGIALPPQACALTLTRGMLHTLDTRGCPTVPAAPAVAAKGGPGPKPFERWFVELGIGRRFASDDAYVATLHDFRYQGKQPARLTPVFVAGFGALRHLSVLARVERLADRRFDRVLAGDRRPVQFSYRSWSLALGLRARLPLLSERLVPFAEFDLGMVTARSEFRQSGLDTARERHTGYVLRANAGLTVHAFWRIGALLSGGYDFAPALKNEFGQKHNDGGFHFTIALRLRGLKEED